MALPKRKEEQEDYADPRLDYPTIDAEFRDRQYNRPVNDNRRDQQVSNVQVVRSSTEPTPQSLKRRMKLRKEIQQFQDKGHSLKEAAAKVRALRASYAIGVTCGWLYIAQVVAWILSIVGLGVAMGLMSIGDFSGGGVKGFFLNIASFFIDLTTEPALYLFAAGWVTSMALGVAQMLIAPWIYMINRVNPYKGNAINWYIFMTAFQFLPLGIIPWGVFWMWRIVVEAGR